MPVNYNLVTYRLNKAGVTVSIRPPLTEECASSSATFPGDNEKEEVAEESGGGEFSAGTFLCPPGKPKKRVKKKKVKSQGTAPEMFAGAVAEVEVCGPVRRGGAAAVSPSAREYYSS